MSLACDKLWLELEGNMDQWILSVLETEQLRNTPDSQPDPSLYRKGELIALVHRDDKRRDVWHLLLSVKGAARPPELDELLDARATLLPNIRSFVIQAGVIQDGWQPPVECFHFYGTEAPRITQ